MAQVQSTALHIEDEISVSTVIDNFKAFYQQELHQVNLNSVGRFRQMLQLQHQDYVLAPYLSTIKNFRSRRLVSRFRCGCHGLHVDTGNFEPVGQEVPREQRFCLVCGSGTAEDEHRFVFDCSAYCSIRERFTTISGDHPLLCDSPLSLPYMTSGSLPSFCMNVLHTGLEFLRVVRGAAALVAIHTLQLFHCHSVDEH